MDIQHKAGVWKVLKCLCLSTASIGYTIKAIEGSTIHLPCHFPSSSQVSANALWFNETGVGTRTLLNLGEGSTGDNERVEQLYPLDHDQTIILRDAVIEDAGIYKCESVEGELLSTIHVIIEGRSGNLFHMLCYTVCTIWSHSLYIHLKTMLRIF